MAYSRRLDKVDNRNRKFRKGDLYTIKHNDMIYLFIGDNEAVVIHSKLPEQIGSKLTTSINLWPPGEKYSLYEGEVVLSNESF